MTDQRAFLPIGTTVELDNDVYQIIGEPIGCGGGSILYPAQKQFMLNGLLQTDGIRYVLKECYPAASSYSYTRADNGEIIPVYKNTEDVLYLQQAQLMQLEEKTISQNIYRTASRMLPIRSCAQSVVLTLPGKEGPAIVPNTMTLMDSLVEKGQALTEWIRQKRRFAPAEAFRIIQQVLFALQEVHEAGYLHLDIQDGNIFFRGSLEQKNEMATLIDFGCARKLINGKTEPIRDKVIFTTHGFSAPEILLHNDGNLQLGPEADLYSVGCLALYLLTGQRANIRELIANRTGIYLRSNQLRRIQCPKHLVDTMQRILARALAKEPENRYQSVEDMRKDVTALTEALQPKSTSLGAVKYDAFVCYKHGAIDSVAALTLQRALENYRVPKGVADQRRPFGRVFVDEGELSSCADFGQQIRDALKNSEWLIVICSADTPLSPWVQLEIDTFLEYHDRSRILAVLTGGNPEISFPSQLKGDADGAGEIFAAHALSSTPQEAEKQLKGDALLRIAAPMLNTTFDTLKQRQKIYRLQRIAAITGGFLLVSVGFAAYAMNRAKIIAEQAIRIEEEYEESLRNESLFLAEQAEKKLASNDSLGAAELALQALPSEQQIRPVLTEAEYALGKALSIYKTPAVTENTATPVGTIDTDCPYIFLSPDETKLYAWDDSTTEFGSLVECWDSETRALLWEHSTDYGLGAQPLTASDGSLVLIGYHSVCSIDADTGLVNWELDLEYLRAVAESADGSRLLAISADHDDKTVTATVLSASTGAKMSSTQFQLPEGRQLQGPICISSDLRYAALSAADEAGWDVCALYLANLETGSCDLLLETETEICNIQFSEDCLLMLRGSGSSFVTQHNVLYEYIVPHTFWLESYRIPEGIQNWSQEISDYFESNNFYKILLTDYDDGNVTGAGVLYVFDDHAVLLNRESGQVIRQYKLPAAAVTVSLTEKGFETVNTDGSSSMTGFGIDTLRNIQYFSGEVSEACKTGSAYFIQNTTMLNRDNTIFHYRLNCFDDAYTPHFTADSNTWSVYCVNPPTNPDRILLTDRNRVCLADIRTEEHWMQTIPGEYHFSESSIVGTSADGQRLYWKGSRNWDDAACWIGNAEYYVLDLYTGDIQLLQQPEKPQEYLYSVDTIFDAELMLTAADWNADKKSYLSVYAWDICKNTLTELLRHELAPAPDNAEGDAQYHWETYLQRSLAYDRETMRATCTINKNGAETLTKLITADVRTGELAVIPLAIEAEEGKTAYECWQNNCQWNASGTQAAFVYNSSIRVVDLSGNVICDIPVTEPVISLRYMPGGEDILAIFQNGMLCRYNVEDAACCASINLVDHCSSLYAIYEENWKWVFPDEKTLLAVTNFGGFLMDVTDQDIKMKAVVAQCIGYDPETDRFIVAETDSYSGKNTTIGSFRQYRTEDLIQKANLLLSK